MGGEHDADLVLGDRLHERLQEFPPRERVEARHRLVQHQQLRPLADARPGGDEAAALQLPVRLQHRVRVDRQPGDDLFHGGQLVSFAQQPQPERVPYLLDDLQVRREPRPRIERNSIVDTSITLGS